MPVAIPFNEDGKEVLIPTVAPDGTELDTATAIEQYKRTGRHHGKFDTPANANSYAEKLEQDRAGAPVALVPPAAAGPAPPAAPAMPTGARLRLGTPVQTGQPTEPAVPAAGPTAPMPSPPPMPSLQQRIEQILPYNPRTGRPLTAEQREIALSTAHSDYSKFVAATEESRARLKHQLTNGAAALADGRPFPWNEAEIRSLIPQPEADELVNGMKDSETAGRMIGPIRISSPAENQKRHEDLLAGLGDPGAPDYLRRRQLANIYKTQLEKHEKDRDEDPARYVGTYYPGIKEKWTAATDPKTGTVENFDDYARSTMAAQTRLGVDVAKRGILPNAVALNEVQRIASLDPKTDKPAEYMRSLAARYGAGEGARDHWPQVFEQFVKNKLPGEYQVLANMDRRDQVVAADDLARGLRLVAEKGGMAVLKSAGGGALPKPVQDDIRTQLADFRKSVGLQADGAKLSDTVEDAVQVLTYYYRFKGKNDNDAVSDAVAGILTNKYDIGEIDNTMIRVPKVGDRSAFSEVALAADRIKADLSIKDLPPIRGNELLKPAERQEIWMDAIRRGGWVNNNNDTGIVLMARPREGGEVMVRRADGSPVELNFSEAPAILARSPGPINLPPRAAATAPQQPTDEGPRLPGNIRSPAPSGTIPPPMPRRGVPPSPVR